MNSTLQDYGGESTPVAGFPYGITLSIPVFFMFILLTYFSYKCRHNPNPVTTSSAAATVYHDDDHHHNQHKEGLDAGILRSYPVLKYQQLKGEDGGGAATTACAICLADYNDGDSLRLLPNCGHVFHVQCVDPWLILHASCPNCRSSPSFLSPVQAPLVGPR